jgi:hypothetical protein
MSEPTKEYVAELPHCPRCGRMLPFGALACDNCDTSLTSHTVINPNDPLGQVYAEGMIYREASNNPDRPIVVVGMWLIWGPILVTCIIADAFFLFAALPDLLSRSNWKSELPFAAFGFLVVCALTAYSGRLLAKTTGSYFHSKGQSA